LLVLARHMISSRPPMPAQGWWSRADRKPGLGMDSQEIGPVLATLPTWYPTCPNLSAWLVAVNTCQVRAFSCWPIRANLDHDARLFAENGPRDVFRNAVVREQMLEKWSTGNLTLARQVIYNCITGIPLSISARAMAAVVRQSRAGFNIPILR